MGIGMMGNLVKNVLRLLTLFFVLLGTGAALSMLEAPEPGDGYFLLYAVIGFALSGGMLWKKLKSRSYRRKNGPGQILIALLMLVMAAGGILAVAALALNANQPNHGYIRIAAIGIVAAVICGGVIWLADRKYR